jgi:L-2-hydroxyglutarate oxidase
LEQGRANGLAGLRWLGADELGAIEPHVRGVAGVHVPEEGIVSYPAVCQALVALIRELGGAVVTGAEVQSLKRDGPAWRVLTSVGDLRTSFLVNAAGLYADRIARLAGGRPALMIIPFRGEYYRLRPERRGLVRHLIYPVPDPAFPFLGVHLTRMIDGEVEGGPNAVLALAREGYRWDQVNGSELTEALLFPGLWRFLARHPRTCWHECRRSLSRRLFAAALARLVPELDSADLLPGGAGVRAQAMTPDGRLVNDFSFARGSQAIHLLNAPSPAATASLAIADEIVRLYRSGTGQPDRVAPIGAIQ